MYCKPRKEHAAAIGLARQGFDVYLPMARIRTASDRRAWTSEPLFPRYLFARPRARGQPLGPILSTRGVRSIVKTRGQFLRAPDRLIAELRTFETHEIDVNGQHAPLPFDAGRMPIAVDGLASGVQAILHCPRGEDRVSLLVGMIARAAIAAA